jgi:hypothetical protein
MAQDGDDRDKDRSPAQLAISAERVRWTLLVVAAVVILLGVAGELGRNFAGDDDRLLPRLLRAVRRNFNPSGEQTAGAWLTASVLLLCGLLLLTTAAARHARGAPFVAHWRVLGIIFLLLSADEAMSLHEQLGDWVQGRLETGGPFLWAWVIPYGLVMVALAVVYLPWLRTLPVATRRRVVVAGVLFVGGALGLEMVQAAIVDGRERGGGPVSVLAVIEEGAELVGAILFLDALLVQLGRHDVVDLTIAVPQPATVEVQPELPPVAELPPVGLERTPLVATSISEPTP